MKKLKDNLTTYFDHLSEREKWMLIGMFFLSVTFVIYLSYYFILQKNIVKLEKRSKEYYQSILAIEDIGPIFLSNNKKPKNTIKPAKEEVQLYSLLGNLASQNGLEIKSINEKPATQEFSEVVTKDAEVTLSVVSLDTLGAFLADIENSKKAPIYIKKLRITREYSDDTKVNIKFIARTFYQKPSKKETK
jgi:type II secretory pathway component PulM